MKKVLLLCKDFDPLNVAGAKRPFGWYSYLGKHGIQVTVLTTTQANEKKERIIRVPIEYSDLEKNILIRKFRSLADLTIGYFIPRLSRYGKLFEEAKRLLKKEKFDFILATGEPFILFRMAAFLGKEHSIKWGVDYRDNWSNNPEIGSSSLPLRLLNFGLYRAIEKNILKRAHIVVTAAISYKKRIQELDPHSEPVVVFNGHEITELPLRKELNTFRIGYAGRLYPHQPIEGFLEALATFSDQNPEANFEMNFYGLADWPDQVKRVENQCSPLLLSKIRFFPSVYYEEYISRLSSCQLLVLLSQGSIGWLNAKIFDYLPMPAEIVLFEGSDGELDLILKREGRGKVLSSIEELIKFFTSQIGQKEITNPSNNDHLLSKYHRKSTSEKLAEAIQNTI